MGFGADTCPGIIRQQFTESILPIITDDLLSETTFCTFELNLCDMDKWIRRDVKEEVFKLLTQKPEMVKDNNYVNNLYDEHRHLFKSPGRETIKIAMMSDLHIDYDYLEGASNDCGKPLCCRSDSGPGTSPKNTAGKWGDYRCDLNTIALDSLLSFIKDEVKPDVVFWGGDSIPHNVDTLTLESNVEIMKNITAQVTAGLEGLKIYPTIGNHDTYPQDVIKMTTPRENEAINQWSPTWEQFIDDPEQVKLFRDWGYFSMPLKNKEGKQLGE